MEVETEAEVMAVLMAAKKAAVVMEAATVEEVQYSTERSGTEVRGKS